MLRVALLIFVALPLAAAPRRVAFTFDDLPGPGEACDIAALGRINRDLVAGIRRNTIPALGLVTDGNLCGHHPELLTIWLDAGLDLGNHTASHRDLNVTELPQFQKDTIAGERTVKPLLEARGKKLRYFRYPFLHSGTSLAKKRAFEAFLTIRGYTNAVVTIDNDEYIYADAYRRAVLAGDSRQAKRIADDYIRYMESIFAFYETLSRDVVGYEVPQILLLHANRLNAAEMDRLAAMVRNRGYSFVSIDEALRDRAYQRTDRYIGRRGLSWLMRWALDDGKNPPMQPDVAPWIMDAYRAARGAPPTTRPSSALR